MSTRFEITLSDALYNSMMDRAREEGLANERDGGRRYMVIRAMRYWLSKNGYSAALLDKTDEEYADLCRMDSKAVPSTRKEG